MDLNFNSDWSIASWILTRVPACSNKVEIESWKASVDCIPQAENIWKFDLQVKSLSALFLLFASCCDTVSGTGTMQITLTIRLLDIAEQLPCLIARTSQVLTILTNNKVASLEAMLVWNYELKFKAPYPSTTYWLLWLSDYWTLQNNWGTHFRARLHSPDSCSIH